MSQSHTADLNGTTQCFTAADSASLSVTGDITIEGWYSFDDTTFGTESPGLVSKFNNGSSNMSYMFYYLESSQTLRFKISIDGTSTANVGVAWTPSNGVWYHLAVTRQQSSGDTKFYVLGIQQGATQTLSAGNAIHDGTSVLRIGESDTGLADFFDGKVDDVRVWNVVRTSAEILANMASCNLSASATGLQAWWTLDNKLTDETANANTLTNVGSATFQSASLPFTCGGGLFLACEI